MKELSIGNVGFGLFCSGLQHILNLKNCDVKVKESFRPILFGRKREIGNGTQ